MARKSLPKPENDPASFLNSIREGIERLWDKHGAAALEFAEDSDNKGVAVSFKVTIDLSKSEAITSVHIGFSQKVTDEVKFTLDDPNQGSFTELIEVPKSNKGESEEPRDGDDQDEDKPKKRGKAKTE